MNESVGVRLAFSLLQDCTSVVDYASSPKAPVRHDVQKHHVYVALLLGTDANGKQFSFFSLLFTADALSQNART